MRLLLLAWALQAGPADWVRDLGDDSIDVRERAAARLLRAGRAAEKDLREALKSPNGEVRGRAAQLLKELERAERARSFDPGPARITLRLEGAAPADLLAELQKQASTKLVLASGGGRVSADLDGVPLFEAVDRLCRAHGGLAYAVERRGDDVSVTLSEGKPDPCPVAFREQFLIRLESIRMTTHFDLQGGASSRTRFAFRWAWEQGTRPASASIRIEDVVDDAGASYGADLVQEGLEIMVGQALVSTQQAFEMPRIPPPGVRALSRIRGDLVLEFPDEMTDFTFKDPEQQAGETETRGGASVRLVYCQRERARVVARAELRPGGAAAHFRFVAVDRQGKEHAGRMTRHQGGEEVVRLDLEAPLPPGEELAALKLSAPAGFRERRIPFEFRDLRIR
jgi:hypothetical protein